MASAGCSLFPELIVIVLTLLFLRIVGSKIPGPEASKNETDMARIRDFIAGKFIGLE